MGIKKVFLSASCLLLLLLACRPMAAQQSQPANAAKSAAADNDHEARGRQFDTSASEGKAESCCQPY
jgi:hypothetical protein